MAPISRLPEVPGFHVVGFLGRGGMGEVFLGRDEVLGRRVALKRLPYPTRSDRNEAPRFHKEARILGRLSHPNVLGVHALREAPDGLYLVMELARGGSLADRIRRRGPLSVQATSTLAAQAARGLEAAWREGVVHRDVKPSNLLLDETGNIKVADFGLARCALAAHSPGDNGPKTSGRQILTSPHYASPEIVRGEAGGFRSDFYSLGVVVFEMLAGRPPFEGSAMSVLSAHLTDDLPDPRSLRPELPRSLVRWLQRMTDKKAARRPDTHEEVVVELLSMTSG